MSDKFSVTPDDFEAYSKLGGKYEAVNACRRSNEVSSEMYTF